MCTGCYMCYAQLTETFFFYEIHIFSLEIRRAVLLFLCGLSTDLGPAQNTQKYNYSCLGTLYFYEGNYFFAIFYMFEEFYAIISCVVSLYIYGEFVYNEGSDQHSYGHTVELCILCKPPFEERWKGRIVLLQSVRSSPTASGVSNLRLSFSGGGIRILWTHF